MPELSNAAPKPRRKLLCGATSCGGCVKECGVVVYKYLAGLDEEDDRETEPESSNEVALPFRIHNS